MSEALIREIAEKIAHEQLIAQWPVYLLMAAISLIIGFFVRIPVMLTNQSSNVTSASSCIDQLMSISDITSFLSAIQQCALKRFLISKLLGVDVQITQQECRIGLLPALPYKFRVIL